jgi:hypothetical protein
MFGQASTLGQPPMWLAPIQKVVFAEHHMRYMVQQQLTYHTRLGFAGVLVVCDYFVCRQLLEDQQLAAAAQAGQLVLWVWVSVSSFQHVQLYSVQEHC